MLRGFATCSYMDGHLCPSYTESAKSLEVTFLSRLLVSPKNNCQGEEDAAELGANTDANHNCTKFSLNKCLADICLFDAN